MNSKIKILIVAPNASSKFGGESFLPLMYFHILHRRGEPVKLIAHARNRDDLAELLGPALKDISFIKDTIFHRSVWKTGSLFPSFVRDTIFRTLLNMINERFQARLIRSFIAVGEVDVIHQPIPVSPLAPSSIYDFGVPVVIGPMNGGMTYPQGYEYLESKKTKRFVELSRKLAFALNRLFPGKRKAAALIVANDRTRNALPFPEHSNIITLVENGVDLDTWAPSAAKVVRSSAEPFKLVFMGRLVGWKAVDMTLEAVSRVRSKGREIELEILGDGPERASLEARAIELGIGDAVHFLGFRPQADCAKHLEKADALILNSVWECGGAVVLEAMAMGLAVIGPDWGGPADYIDDSCGILVSPVPRADFADRLAAAIMRLAADPSLCQRMGEAGAEKIRTEFDWEKKVDRMMEIYTEVAVGG